MTLANCTGPCAEKIRSLDLRGAQGAPGDEALLEHTLGVLLCSAAPKLLLWGTGPKAFYNDAFLALDPAIGLDALGRNYAQLCAGDWETVRPYVLRVSDGEVRITADLCGFGKSDGKGSFPRHCRCYFVPVADRDGAIRGVLVDVHDMAADRQSSEHLLIGNRRLQDLFSEAPVMLAYVRSSDLRLQFANPAFRAFHGDRPIDGLLIQDAIPETEEQGFVTLLKRVIETGEPYVASETQVVLRQGSRTETKYADFVYQAVKDERGQVAGVLCAATDVTEKVQARIDRDNLRHQVLHASRVNAMGTVAMTLAHELSQPLAAATNYLTAARYFLVDGGPTDLPEILDGIESARSQVVRAGDIIKRLRPLIRSGGAERQEVAVSAAVDRAVALLVAADGFALKVTKDISPEAGAVLADPIQLEQVLVNILRNANEASRASSRKEVVIATRPLRNGCASVSLRDFGPGLGVDKLEELQGVTPPAAREGLGVGLALCRSLIEANQGNMRAANAAGAETGAIFTIDLEIA